jgi:hypothetical protein
MSIARTMATLVAEGWRARRRPALAAVTILVAVGVVVLWSPASGAAERTTPVELVTASPRERAPSALDDPTAEGLPKPLIDSRRLISGGPPPDGIPAIDRPRFERAKAVDWLDAREPVLAFNLGADARAYPVRILIWHEIVNDTVDGVPVAITYCPLCNSALAFDRRVSGRVVDFGTSGLLYPSDLVMYDRQTESLWPHIERRAVAGVLTGTQLKTLPIATVSWRDWRATNPDSWVLSIETGFDRPYGTNPYVGYDDPTTRPFLYDGKLDSRLNPKARVVGIDDGDRGIAVTLTALRKRAVVELTVDGRPMVLWWKAGTASALESAEVSSGRDIGATKAFEPIGSGQTLHFTTTAEGAFRDRETGSTWDFFGRATAGPLIRQALPPATHLDTFWFSWSAFHPHTKIVGRSTAS